MSEHPWNNRLIAFRDFSRLDFSACAGRKVNTSKYHRERIKFVQCLEQFPCLYDKTSKLYKNNISRHDALLSLSQLMGYNAAGGIKTAKNMLLRVRARVNGGTTALPSGSAAAARRHRQEHEELRRAGAYLIRCNND